MERLIARVAQANPVPADGPSDEAEAERVMQRVLSAAVEQRVPRRAGLRSVAAFAASVVVVVVVVAVALLGHGRTTATSARSAPAQSGSFTLITPSRVRNPPAISVPPGMLTIASLGVHHGVRYYIYGQRIRFERRLYFCLFVGNRSGSAQACQCFCSHITRLSPRDWASASQSWTAAE